MTAKKKPTRKRAPRKPKRKPLGHDEMVEILEDLARTSQNAAARIAAVKALAEINKDDTGGETTGFEGLYAVPSEGPKRKAS